MKVQLTAITPNAERHCEMAARDCYDSSDKAKDDGTPSKLVKGVTKKGHITVIGHASATFRLSQVTRALMAQITRHRTAVFSIRSQRYVNHGIKIRKTLDEHYFDVIDNKTKAYILGWLFSNGEVCTSPQTDDNTISLITKPSDEYMLCAIKNIIGVKEKIYKYEDGTSKLQISSKYMCGILEKKYGLIPHNPLARGVKLVFKNIPEKFHKSFLLGMFDGDGIIGSTQGSYIDASAGIYSFSDEFVQDLKDNFDIFKDSKAVQSGILFQGQHKVANFLAYLYSDTDFGQDLFLLSKFSKSLKISKTFFDIYKDKVNNDVFDIPQCMKTDSSVLSLYIEASKMSFYNYSKLIGMGLYQEDARGLLNNSCYTTINMTMTFEGWLHFLRRRMDKHAQLEIRNLANNIYTELHKEAPLIFNKDTIESCVVPSIDWDSID